MERYRTVRARRQTPTPSDRPARLPRDRGPALTRAHGRDYPILRKAFSPFPQRSPPRRVAPASDTNRGRPNRWPQEKLREAIRQLRTILERETSGRISPQLRRAIFASTSVSFLRSRGPHGRARQHSGGSATRPSLFECLVCMTIEACARRRGVIVAALGPARSQSLLRLYVKEIIDKLDPHGTRRLF
jgi:hypothetical protein